MLHIICEKQEWRDRVEDSSLLDRDIMSLSGWFPAFRRIAVPSSSGSSSPDRFTLTLRYFERTGNTHQKSQVHITEHSNFQQYRCESLNFSWRQCCFPWWWGRGSKIFVELNVSSSVHPQEMGSEILWLNWCFSNMDINKKHQPDRPFYILLTVHLVMILW